MPQLLSRQLTMAGRMKTGRTDQVAEAFGVSLVSLVTLLKQHENDTASG